MEKVKMEVVKMKRSFFAMEGDVRRHFGDHLHSEEGQTALQEERVFRKRLFTLLNTLDLVHIEIDHFHRVLSQLETMILEHEMPIFYTAATVQNMLESVRRAQKYRWM